MRALILAAALLAAACSVETHHDANAAAHGYRLEVRADHENKIFLITAPDGRAAGGMVSGGQSTLLTARAMELLARVPDPAATNEAMDDEHHVSFHAPGVSVEASGNGDDDDETSTSTSTSTGTAASADHGRAHVSFNLGGHSMEIDAQERGGDGEHGNAHVVISGADEKTARSFINDDDDLSATVKQQMLQAVGL